MIKNYTKVHLVDKLMFFFLLYYCLDIRISFHADVVAFSGASSPSSFHTLFSQSIISRFFTRVIRPSLKLASEICTPNLTIFLLANVCFRMIAQSVLLQHPFLFWVLVPKQRLGKWLTIKLLKTTLKYSCSARPRAGVCISLFACKNLHQSRLQFSCCGALAAEASTKTKMPGY